MDEATKKYRNGEELAKKRQEYMASLRIEFPGSASEGVFALLEDAHKEIAWLWETYDESKCVNLGRNLRSCFYDSVKHYDGEALIEEYKGYRGKWVKGLVRDVAAGDIRDVAAGDIRDVAAMDMMDYYKTRCLYFWAQLKEDDRNGLEPPEHVECSRGKQETM
jgi:hypothetical protein